MKFTFAIFLIIFGLISNTILVIAALPPPPDTGTPNGERIPGGTRPEQTTTCKQTNKPLTALVPENAKGFTATEYPSFWFYIPYALQDINSIEFSLHNQEETTTLYRTFIKINNTPGIIGIYLPKIPKNSLQINNNYHWYFKVNCKSKKNLESDSLVLDGWVTRTQPNSNFTIWYDELTNVAKSYIDNPHNPENKKKWSEILKTVGLEELVQVPVVIVETRNFASPQ